MRRYCTLFDSGYLTRALVLYESLRAVRAPFRLTAFCFDDEALEIFQRLTLDDVECVGLRELEEATPELAAVKPGRSRGEYCWTSTPCTISYVLDRMPGAA